MRPYVKAQIFLNISLYPSCLHLVPQLPKPLPTQIQDLQLQAIMQILQAAVVGGMALLLGNVSTLSTSFVPSFEQTNSSSLSLEPLSTAPPQNDTLQLGDPPRRDPIDGRILPMTDPNFYIRFFHHGTTAQAFQAWELLGVIQIMGVAAYQAVRHHSGVMPARGPQVLHNGHLTGTMTGVTFSIARKRGRAGETFGADDLTAIMVAIAAHVHNFAAPPFRFEYGLGRGQDPNLIVAEGILCRLGSSSCSGPRKTNEA